MKKILGVILTLAVLVGILIPAAGLVAAGTESDPDTTPLIAGQNTVVGDVSVWNDGDNLHITYEITEADWIITTTHLYVGKTNPSGVDKNGNPLTSSPGQFPYDDADAFSVTDTTVAYVIPLEDIDSYHMQLNNKGKPTGVLVADGTTGVVPGDDVYIATHAEVELPETGHVETYDFCLVSGSDTELVGGGNASVATYNPWGTTVPTNVNNIPGCTDVASWIWDVTRQTGAYADTGDMVDFVQSFNIIGTPTSATFKIAADNSFAYNFNTSAEIDENLAAGWRDQANLGNFAPTSPNPLAEPVVVIDPNSSGWSQVYTYDVLADLQSGANTLYVTGVNADWNTTSWTVNPGAVIYKLCGTSEEYIVDRPYRSETAWGEGDPIDVNGNWSMYFVYAIQGWQLVETVIVPSTNWAGVFSASPLIAGDSYKFVASGTWAWTGGASETVRIADAEYAYRTDAAADPVPPDGWTIGETTYASVLGFDVLVDNYQPYAIPPTSTTEGNVYWGDYNPEHIYTYYYTGTGNTVHFNIYDNVYSDNYGVITIQIYHWE